MSYIPRIGMKIIAVEDCVMLNSGKYLFRKGDLFEIIDIQYPDCKCTHTDIFFGIHVKNKTKECKCGKRETVNGRLYLDKLYFAPYEEDFGTNILEHVKEEIKKEEEIFASEF